jgi:hypothetical protein
VSLEFIHTSWPVRPPDVRNVPVFIYGLTDPTNDVIRYVGKTQSPEKRLAAHRYSRLMVGRALRFWLDELRAAHRIPRMVILETVPPGEDASKVEQRAIAAHDQGQLLNYYGVSRDSYTGRPLNGKA